MTPACETILNPFIGSECGKRGKVVVRSGNVFTPLKAITIIPKQRPFLDDLPISTLQEAGDVDDLRTLRASLKRPENDIDYEIVRQELDL